MQYVRHAVAWQSSAMLAYWGRDPLGELLATLNYELAKHAIVPIVAIVPALLVALLILWKCTAVLRAVGGTLLAAALWLFWKLLAFISYAAVLLVAVAAFGMVYVAAFYLLMPYGDTLATYWLGHGAPAPFVPPPAAHGLLDRLWALLGNRTWRPF